MACQAKISLRDRTLVETFAPLRGYQTLDNGKPIRESRDIDIPLVARHFYFHAGAAQLMEKEMPDHRAHGVVGQVIPWNFLCL